MEFGQIYGLAFCAASNRPSSEGELNKKPLLEPFQKLPGPEKQKMWTLLSPQMWSNWLKKL